MGTTFLRTKMFGCCACNILCVGLVSLVLTSPLLFPCILGQLSSTSLTSDNTTVSSSLLQTALELLQTIPDQSYQDKVIDEITKNELNSFFEGFISNLEKSSYYTLGLACINIFTIITLLIGSCCQLSCLLLPWLVVSMLEFVCVAIPAAIFLSLLGVYMYFKGIFIYSIVVIAVPSSFLIINLIMWFIVLSAYYKEQPKQYCQDEEENEEDPSQPLMSNYGGHDQPRQYNLEEYPQYYPTQPTAPPTAPNHVHDTGIHRDQLYPSMPVN